MGVVLLPAGLLAMVVAGPASPASAVGVVSSTVDASNGFPAWYQDATGSRVAQCLDPADPNCVVLASASFDPAAPTVFPTNFPDEFFYTLADSDLVTTPGCLGTAPGRASVRIATEGAFINGAPAAADRMVFGRIRVKVTSGLCPNTTYRFRHPFGTETLTTNAAGGIPANVGTEDIGCVPAPGAPCNFAAATASRVFGTAGAGGFLRWDPAFAPAAPAGYLGDGGATLHEITGGTTGNAFRILDSVGNDTGLGTALFGVAGKLAGSLVANPDPADFGGVPLGAPSAAKTVTVTNVDSAAVTLGAATATSAEFAVTGGSCATGTVLTRDQSCTYAVTFTPITLAGRRSATLDIPSAGGVRSPLSVRLTGAGTNLGAAPTATLSTSTLAFGDVRVRTTSPLQHIIVTNNGTAPLGVTDVSFDPATVPEPDQYRILGDTCSTGVFVDPGSSCSIDVEFAPFVTGDHPTALLISSNAGGGLDAVTVTGRGTGGVAAVSPNLVDSNGFPEWYRDEAGVKVSQCIDPADANCIVLADDFFDPAAPLHFPDNFPSEFFYQVATSDLVDVQDPTCATSTVGKSLMRSAVEGAFTGGGPVPGDQMVFGRIRFSVTGGLCPNSEYVFTSPYGADHFTSDASGAVRRAKATDDTGCAPLPGETCDWKLALSSRVLGGLLRWDPTAAPLAPAGYLGDAATLHTVVGAPFSSDGTSPNNFYEITRADDGTVIGRTDLFSVMGKMQGPLESDRAAVEFPAIPIGSTSGTETVRFTNTGIAPITVDQITLGGADQADFTVGTESCTGSTLAVDAHCDVSVSFSPTATGNRTGVLGVAHSGLNNPASVALSGIGGAVGTSAAISFSPRSITFAQLHTGSTSPLQTVTVSNAGGTLPLTIVDPVTIGGTGAASFSVVDNRCVDPVDPGATCQIDIAFTPQSAGPKSGTLVLTDNAPGTTHTVALTGIGSDATATVSASVDPRNGFPSWYQDANGVRLEPCLDVASGHCVVLRDATFNPANPVSFPTNFPGEFFYALADSNIISTPGCAGTAPGTAFLRVALEGSFAGGTPAVGDQTTFGRIRIVVTSGLCASTPYTFLTPYGTFQFTTDANGGFARNDATTNVGCGAAPCNFADAVVSLPAGSFLRWAPINGLTPPAGFLGDGTSYRKVVGGTYIPAGASQPVNEFTIADSAGNVVGSTDTFLVSAKVAGPLLASSYTVDFGHQPSGQVSGAQTITVTNAGDPGTSISSISLTGGNAGEFQVLGGGTCTTGAGIAQDGSCTLRVAFAPVSTGVKSTTLRVAPSSGPALLVTLKGLGDPAPAPAISVTPGVLAYGTVTAPAAPSLSTTVRNTGNANLLVGAPVIGGTTTDYAVTANTCAAGPVAPGATCTITVTFRPTAIGARTGTLTIPHNATGGQTVVSLTGTGLGSTFVVSPNPVTFGSFNRNTTKTQTVGVRNSGTIAFRVTNATIVGAQAAAFGVTGPGCLNTVLQPGKSCNLSVTLRPTAAIGYTATLVVTGDGTSLPSTVSATLTGTGK